MSSHTNDLDRREISFVEPRIREVLPEHFLTDYPNLVLFLEKYYQFLQTDPDVNFTQQIETLLSARDILETPIDLLGYILKEIGSSVIAPDYFKSPRYAARLIAEFYRAKGSLYSSEAFFKAFYGIDAEIEYPKRQVFVIDYSPIGPEGLHFIQDGALYQTLSILVKSELPISIWGDLYKKLVHPAGFYLGSQVVINSIATLGADIMPDVIAAPVITSITDVATLDAASITEMTRLEQVSGTSTPFVRTSVDEDIGTFQDLTIGQLQNLYPTIESIITISSPKFDNADSGSSSAIDMSNELETTDLNRYEWWDSDSDGYQSQLL